MLHSEPLPLREKVWTSLVSVAPLRAYTRFVRAVSAIPLPRALRPMIWTSLGARIGMQLDEAELGLEEYGSFSELFVRRLRAGVRPSETGKAVVVSPVDGCVSASGVADGDRLLQAKGLDYSLTELVGNTALGARLKGGAFVTLYLRPKDYHRIHAPLAAELISLRRWSGTLFPVQPSSVRTIKGLFVRNERVVLEFRIGDHQMAAVFVGATAVGAISTPFEDGSSATCTFPQPLAIERGDEIGTFHLGSTVILLFEPGLVSLDELPMGQEVRVGHTIGQGHGNQRGGGPR